MSFLACTYGSICAGCDWLLKPAELQASMKVETLRASWQSAEVQSSLGDVEFVKIAKGGLRDRVDLMLEQHSDRVRLGLFDRFMTGVVDLQGCPQMSPALESWLNEFRKINKINVKRGSVRLRVSPSGLRGVWLDLANLDVKSLLESRDELNAFLVEGVIVEIGQKRKRLVEIDGQLKLGEPQLEPWFQTYLPEATPLYCTVGSFTQPGFATNRVLTTEVMKLFHATGAKRVAEFGSGIGNFTLPVAANADHVDAYEVDELALKGLRLSLAKQKMLTHVQVHSGNFQAARREGEPNFENVDLILVDPPRSGLMKFLDPVAELPLANRPEHFIYVSCFAESFATDSRRLSELGYQLNEIKIVDQFPQSHHFEIVAAFALQR